MFLVIIVAARGLIAVPGGYRQASVLQLYPDSAFRPAGEFMSQLRLEGDDF